MSSRNKPVNDQVSELETAKILALAKECLAVAGDYVELGCYKGETSQKLAEILKNSNKKLWLYDSFEGLPEKTIVDSSAVGDNFQTGELLAAKREVREKFLRAGLPLPYIKKAWFKDLTSADLPEKIAFAFLDGDLYESIRDSLKLVQSKMMPGGVILVHDFENPALPGVTKAVEEWMGGRDIKLRPRFMKYQTLAIIMV